MKLLFVSIFFFFQWLRIPFSEVTHSDSSRAVRVIARTFPQNSKRDYRRFMKIYSDPMIFEKLVKHQDSARIQQLFGKGDYMGRDLFVLTFNLTEKHFSYALVYQNRFTRFKVKHDQWYLRGFAILFDSTGKASSIMDDETRGQNLFDKRRMKSL